MTFIINNKLQGIFVCLKSLSHIPHFQTNSEVDCKNALIAFLNEIFFMEG